MEVELTRLVHVKQVLTYYGRGLILGLVVLIVGLLVIKWLTRHLRDTLSRMTDNITVVSITTNVISILLLACVIIFSAVIAGFEARPVVQFLTVMSLVSIGLVVFFRQYIPTLPFKVGETVKAGDLLGKIEGTTVLNTRLRTFDGKTVFVPNKSILNDIVINYHYTPTRRVKIDIPLRYDQDLMKAKQTIESVMIGDPRVLVKPRPVVWILSLSQGCIMLAGRCWVDNKKYWTTRCDLLEKTILRFKHEKLVVSYPHVGVHHFHESGMVDGDEFSIGAPTDIPEEANEELEEMG
jgi:small conductance mechanosensitive channel